MGAVAAVGAAGGAALIAKKIHENKGIGHGGWYQNSGGEDFSLVAVFPQTGRTHQIRVHFSHLGYPLVSDLFYAGKKRLKSDLLWCPRLFLHAKKIGFYHPKNNKWVEFVSELPADLKKALKSLKRKD